MQIAVLRCALIATTAIAGDHDDATDFKLTVAPAEQENILYEPVVFRITLEYVGEKPAVVVPAWDRVWGSLQVLLAARPRSKGQRQPPEAANGGVS